MATPRNLGLHRCHQERRRTRRVRRHPVTSFVTDPSDCRIRAFGSSRFEKIAEPHIAMPYSTTTKINTSPTTSGSDPPLYVI